VLTLMLASQSSKSAGWYKNTSLSPAWTRRQHAPSTAVATRRASKWSCDYRHRSQLADIPTTGLLSTREPVDP